MPDQNSKAMVALYPRWNKLLEEARIKLDVQVLKEMGK